MSIDIVVRSATKADIAFIDGLLMADAEAVLADIDPAQRWQLASMQVRARRTSYAMTYPRARDHVIVADGQPVGRLLLDEQPDVVLVVDIRIAATSRGEGIGATVLTRVCDDAARHGRAVELSADPQNPATRLYARLGFAPASVDHHSPDSHSPDSHPAFTLWRREVTPEP